METIKIFMDESGLTTDLQMDTPIFQGHFHNKLFNIFVPTSIIDNATAVKIGAIKTSDSGKRIQTREFYLNYVKTLIIDGKEYALYERLLPKAFTTDVGTLQLVINVVSTKNGKIQTVVSSQVNNFTINASTYVNDIEVIDTTNAEQLSGKINQNTAILETKQDKIDENLQTEDKTVVGAINENTSQIATNANDIKILKQQKAVDPATNTTLGTMKGSVNDNLSVDIQNGTINDILVGGKNLKTHFTNIESVIPSQASASNQLADKNFVNSSIATNTADFKGTVNSVEELPTENININDYAFVITTDDSGNTLYKRYKYTAQNTWEFEYTLNNSSFTSSQWSAINSGATTSKISQIDTNTTEIGNLKQTFLPIAGGTMSGALNMNNQAITNANHIQIADPGENEGIEWLGGNGWKIFESGYNNSDKTFSNNSGDLQFTSVVTINNKETNIRRATLSTGGILATSGYIMQKTDITKGEAPAKSIWGGISCVDNGGKRLWILEQVYNTDKSSSLYLRKYRTYNPDDTTTEYINSSYLELGSLNNGKGYVKLYACEDGGINSKTIELNADGVTKCPTPSADSNTDAIATTAWVNSAITNKAAANGLVMNNENYLQGKKTDGTAKNLIGIDGNNNILFGTSENGLVFESSGNVIRPFSGKNNLQSIGTSGIKFKDAHFSGTGNFGSIVSNGSINIKNSNETSGVSISRISSTDGSGIRITF